MAAIIPDEKRLVFLDKKIFRKFKTQQHWIVWDKCCHLGLMEPHWVNFNGTIKVKIPFRWDSNPLPPRREPTWSKLQYTKSLQDLFSRATFLMGLHLDIWAVQLRIGAASLISRSTILDIFQINQEVWFAAAFEPETLGSSVQSSTSKATTNATIIKHNGVKRLNDLATYSAF